MVTTTSPLQAVVLVVIGHGLLVQSFLMVMVVGVVVVVVVVVVEGTLKSITKQ